MRISSFNDSPASFFFAHTVAVKSVIVVRVDWSYFAPVDSTCRSACMLELEYSIVHILSEMNGVIGASNFRTVESTLCSVNIAEFFCSADTPSML